MANYVIVHGGWGGGWEWQAVARGLRALGHEVETPTLTGLGDRAHLGRPDTGLVTHIEDVVATISTRDLDEVILAGQSYGGMVVTGVADRIPERLSRLVYIDAFVPIDGESCNDLCGPAWTARVRELARSEGDGWRVPLPFDGNLGLPDEVAAWYVPRLCPQPLATLDDPIALAGGDASGPPRTYVRFLDAPEEEQADPLAGSARRAREAGWDYVQVVAPHDLHVSEPERLVDLLAPLGR